MNTTNEAKKNNSAAARVEYERLFGKGTDLFKNYYAVLGIRNILKTIGVRTSHDSDWFKAVAEFITSSEVSELYDSILSPRKRNTKCDQRGFRNPPELAEDDPDDIIAFLSKNVVYRKKMWQKMLVIYEKRLEEYKAALEAEDRKKSAVEIRFKEMEELFSLSEKEVHALMAVFLSETNNAEYGDFDINRFRSGEKVKSERRTKTSTQIA